MVYIDDTLIFTETIEEHQEVTHQVLKLLEENQLYLKPDKCEFERTWVKYLRVIISHNSVEMDPAKVSGVVEWPVPTTKKELQSFLGFTNFYRRFIQDFSHHARPLFDLTKNNAKWHWSGEEQSTFDTLKGLITSTPVLASLDNTRPFQTKANSSDFAMGVVLSQQAPEDGSWHLVAFLSKSLSAVEWNYKIHDKEMLTIIRAMEEWRHFLEGAEHSFKVWTDHKNLEYFQSTKKLNCRQARWSLFLARFDFVLHHRLGKSMGKPDALSRRSNHRNRSDDNSNLTLLTPSDEPSSSLGQYFRIFARFGSRVTLAVTLLSLR